jgi:perosamine synthetase
MIVTPLRPSSMRLEEEIADYCQVPHALMLSNAARALRLAWSVLGIGSGDRVICPAFTSMAALDAIRIAGATPVFADVDPHTYTLRPEAVPPLVDPQTEALLVAHPFGIPADLDALRGVADEHGLRMVEDAGPALGSRYRGRPVGAEAELACFDFGLDGAVITTTSSALAERLRALRDHDDQAPDEPACGEDQTWGVYLAGYYTMSETQAAACWEQVRRLDESLARRRELAGCYARALSDHVWLRVPTTPAYAVPNFASYPIQLADGAPRSRVDVVRALRQAGIDAVGLAIHGPLGAIGGRTAPVRAAWVDACRRSVVLPLSPNMGSAEVNRAVEVLRSLGRPHRGEPPPADRPMPHVVPEWPREERSPPLCAES